MDDRKWFYGSATQKIGPVDVPTMQTMVREGRMLATTLVWTEGMAQWVQARTLPFLFPPNYRPDDGLNLVLPVGPQSAFAIAAGYLGLFSLVPGLSFVTGPLAIIFGVLALKDLKQNPQKRGTGRAITGLVCGPLGLLLGLALFFAR